MTEHGIHNCKSNFWIHWHPLERRGDAACPCIYWYSVAHCREHISRRNLSIQSGYSKDASRTATGAGYLIPKSSLFVVRQQVPVNYANDYRWSEMTDREAGAIAGPRCVELMVMKREIWLPDRMLLSLNDRTNQLNGCDCELVIAPRLVFEIKTERVLSENLFVQTDEQGHRVHFTPNGVERFSQMDRFAEDRR